MQKFARKVVNNRKLIIIISLILLVPAFIEFLVTPVNYDILTYLPESMDSVKGEHIFSDEFGKGAFAMVMVDDMEYKDVAKLKKKIEKIDSVDDVIWYDTVADVSVPTEILPDKLYTVFNNENTTLMAVFFETGISEGRTLDALTEMRHICGEQAFISGMSSFVLDLKELSHHEEPIYVAIAVVLALILLSIFMDSFAVGVIFLIGIGITILYNMGTNFILGDVSYITFAIAAVLQLAVTMDYSIFLWHSYEEQRALGLEREDAMTEAIARTMVSITGSSLTTIAGFLALCFMTFTLGFNLGVVMAKGVLFGVLGSVTILPSLLLTFEKLIDRTRHRTINLDFGKVSDFVVRRPLIALVVFVIAIAPAFYGYLNTDVYYKLDEGVPQTLPFAVANDKLANQFGIRTTHILLLDSELSQKDISNMMSEMEDVKGVNRVLGLGSLLSPAVPDEIVPGAIRDIVKGDEHTFLLIASDYATASDEVNAQLDELNTIVKKYDQGGMLIGEAPGTKDLINISNHDFKIVTAVSVLVIFLIIALVLQSLSLPFILVACIELAIFINLGIPFFTGTKLSFIDSICISTIQLGATVDYAILMTSRYKEERLLGYGRSEAVKLAHNASAPSILVSALSFFAATVGVAVYSNIDIISSMVGLMSRGAIISMLVVIFILPSFLYLFDGVIVRSTRGMKSCREE